MLLWFISASASLNRGGATAIKKWPSSKTQEAFESNMVKEGLWPWQLTLFLGG